MKLLNLFISQKEITLNVYIKLEELISICTERIYEPAEQAVTLQNMFTFNPYITSGDTQNGRIQNVHVVVV